jgi:hypothetical protein
VGDITNAVKKIKERDFNNNSTNSQTQLGVRSTGATSIGFITVKSTKEFEDKVKRGETIPYVAFEPKSNLLKVEVKNFN